MHQIVTRSQENIAPLKFFFEGDDYFEALTNAIVAAKSAVDLEYYYLASDSMGWDFAGLLQRKATEGVKVRLIYDAFGCRWTSLSLFEELEKAGVQLKVYNPPVPLLKTWNRRDHRKLAIIDGEVAFIGGFNIAEDYCGKYSGSKCWRDTGVRVQNRELVRELLVLFEASWKRRERSLKRFLRSRKKRPALLTGTIHLVPNFGWKQKSLIRQEYLSAIIHAQQSIDITNPYFVPDHGIRRALKKAGRRGVAVRVLTAGTTDVPPARWAGHATYSGLLRSGVRIFEYQGRVLHAKSAAIDGKWFTVGTANIDHMSFFKNLERNLFGRDAAAAEALSRQFEEDLQSSREIIYQNWKRRSWFAKVRERIFFWFREWL